jgi:hypothetical protein
MKIKALDQHCGNCGVTEYCGNPFGFCLCHDLRFGDMEESEYAKIAENATGIKKLGVCEGCTRPDCEVYRYGDDNFADEACEHNDEAKDFYCEQIAAFVESST